MTLNSLTQRFSESRFIATSLLLHLVLITALGGVVLFKSVQPTESFTAGAGVEDGFLTEEPSSSETVESAQPQEFEEPAAAPMEVAAVKSFESEMSALTAPGESSWNVSAPSETYTRGSSFGASTQIGHGTSTSVAKGTTGAKLGKMGSRSLFGTKIEASKLGAVVDISGTACPFLLPTLKEVQKNFDDSPVVLAVGCALAKTKGTAVPFEKVDLEQKIPAGVYNGVSYLQGAIEKSKEVARLVRKLKTTPNVYLLEGNGLDVGAAFDKLIDSQVDGIYWFSDFRDKVSEESAKATVEKLQSRGIKLYIHTFTGKPVPPTQTRMVENTGGKIITAIPK